MLNVLFILKSGKVYETFLKLYLKSKELNHKKVTSLKFGTEVSLMRYNVEEWKNGGGTAAFAENSCFLSIYLSFLAKLEIFNHLETNFLFNSVSSASPLSIFFLVLTSSIYLYILLCFSWNYLYVTRFHVFSFFISQSLFIKM